MSLAAKVVSFNIGTGAAGTTVTVPHGLGVAPKVLKLWWSGRTEAVDAAGLGTYQRGFGWSKGSGASDSIALANVAAHNGAGAANLQARAGSTAACILTITTGFAVDGKADVQSWDATNVVFEILDQFAVDLRVSMLVAGGSDIQNVALGTFLSNTSGTPPFTRDITGLGFTPLGNGRSLLLLAATGAATFDETVTADSTVSLGMATAPTQRGMVYTGADSAAATTAVRSYTQSVEVVASPLTSPGAINWRADFNAWIADGFQLNNLEINGTAIRAAYLVIDGPKFAVLQANASTTNGADIAVTGAGFQPDAGLVLSVRETVTAQDTLAAGGGITMGAWDGTTQVAHSTEQLNNAATSSGGSAVEHDRCYVGINVSTGAVETAMTFQSKDADGCTYDMTDGDTGTYQFHSVLIGAAPAAVSDGTNPLATGIGEGVTGGLLSGNVTTNPLATGALEPAVSAAVTVRPLATGVVVDS